MNQIIATVAISYISPYFYRLAIDLFTSLIVKKTSNIAKKEIKKVWSNLNGFEEDIEYEMMDLESDEIIIVNSKERKKSIDASWMIATPGPDRELTPPTPIKSNRL